MTRPIWFSIALIAGCTNQAAVEGRTCPCADGYTCCITNVCVPEGAACSVVEAPDVDRTAEPCSSNDDNDADGIVDTQWTYHYDELGNDVRDEGDDHLDGTIDTVVLVGYDDARQYTELVEQTGGVEDFRETRTFDSMERLSTDVISNGDGTSMHVGWSYDGMTAVKDTDNEGDGVIDLHEVIEQNSLGLPVSGTKTNGDGSAAGGEAWEYSSTGKLIVRDQIAPDGVPTRHTTYVRDDAGRVLHRQTTLRDGSVDIDWVYNYDDAGRLLSYRLVTLAGFNLVSTFQYSCR